MQRASIKRENSEYLQSVFVLLFFVCLSPLQYLRASKKQQHKMRKQLQPRQVGKEERSSKAMASMLAKSEQSRKISQQTKKSKERKERAQSKGVVAFVARASICIVITIRLPTGDGSRLARKKNSFWRCSFNQVSVNMYAYTHTYICLCQYVFIIGAQRKRLPTIVTWLTDQS